MPESLESVDPVIFDRVWRVICEIGSAERHFNTLQQTYRALASTWLLAGFGATGFVLEKLGNSTVPRDALLAAIGIAGGIGILLLWDLDLLVYHRLLDSFFIEGLRLEQQYRWLPPVRENMMAVHRNQGILPKVVWFYSVSSSLLLVLAAVGLFNWLRNFHPWVAILGSGLEVLVAMILEVIMIRKTNRTDFEPGHRSGR